MEIKKGDNVVVITGEEKGKKATVIKVIPAKNRVVLDGLNMVTKHVKARGANQPGGKTKQPAPIDASNVMLVCPVCGAATKVAHDKVDGKNVRKCKKCGAIIDAKKEAPKKATAKKTVKKSAKNAEAALPETEAAVTEAPATEVAPKAKKAPTKRAPAKKAAPKAEKAETEVK